MISEMASIAVDCVKNPKRRSVWSPELDRYVCPDTEEGKKALAAAQPVPRSEEIREKAARHPPIDTQFKLVFLTAAGGTLLFALLCVTLSFVAGKEPPPLFEKLVMGLIDLVKIGFGAMAGLLGGKTLQGETRKSSAG